MCSTGLVRALIVALSCSLIGCGQTGRTASGGGHDDPSSTSTTSSSSSSGGATGTPLRILNWNTRNFFDTQNDPATDDDVKSATQYATQRKAVGAQIAALDPDIAVFSEVEHQSVLSDLVQSELGSRYPEARLIDGNDPRGIDVGIISKLPLDSVVSHKDDTFVAAGTTGPTYRFVRDCLEVHLTHGGRKIVLLAVHYRAKGTTDDPQKRLAEAQQTRTIADGIMAADPDAGVVVLGDYNDLPGSPPVLAVAGAEPSLFTDAAQAVPESERWTFDYEGKLELIDHQMANPLMASWLDPSSVTIPHGALVSEASDHSPIFAVYYIK